MYVIEYKQSYLQINLIMYIIIRFMYNDNIANLWTNLIESSINTAEIP